MNSTRNLAYLLTILGLIFAAALTDEIGSRAAAQPSATSTQAGPSGMMEQAPSVGMSGMQGMQGMKEMQGMGPMSECMRMCRHHHGAGVLAAIIGIVLGLSAAFAFISLGLFLLRRSNQPRPS
jgi:hypothetical protein